MKCKVPGCPYDTEEDIAGISATGEHLQLLGFHVEAVHPKPGTQLVAGDTQAPTPVRLEKIQCPKLELKGGSCSEEQWEYFTFRWEQYKTMVEISGREKKNLALGLGDEVVGLVFHRLGRATYTALTEEGLLREAKHLVVKSRNKLVHRLKLGTMVQGGDESVTSFETRLKPVARTGKFQVKCSSCEQLTDYTDHMVLDNLIRGLADEEIKRKVLATPETECTLEKIIKFVEAEESGKCSLSESKLFDSVAVVSSFRKQQMELGKQEDTPPGGLGVHRTCGQRHTFGKCPKIQCKFCGEMGHIKKLCEGFKKLRGSLKGKPDAKNSEEAHDILDVSDSMSRGEEVKKQREHKKPRRGAPDNKGPYSSALTLRELSGIYRSSITVAHRGGSKVLEVGSSSSVRKFSKKLRHMKFDKASGHFVPTEKRRQNRVMATYAVDKEQYRNLSTMLNEGFVESRTEQLIQKTVNKESVADTGATVVCGGTDIMQDLGLNLSELLPTATTLFTADRTSLTVLGAIPVDISVVCVDGSTVATKEILYIVAELTSVFISREALSNMGIIPREFPRVKADISYGLVAGVQGSCADTATDKPCISPMNYRGNVAECGCPVREQPPEPPGLPFEATEGNRNKLRQFLIDKYRASTFNTCQHQPLPMMHGPPLEFFIQKDARPYAVYQPGKVPVHWEEKVKKDLDRDVALGVLEKVPENTPMTWCHRMVICRKHNGDPRRTVDMQKLNDVSVRQCHPTSPPLEQAMTVPHNTKKSTLDAWNGYHSVAIREEDRHLTTFYTKWGRFRYKSAPQGYQASGDAYTHRYDKITMGLQNIRRVIDDTLLYARDLEESFKQVAEYLTLVGKNGIILNCDKFCFGEDTVDWAGIRLTKDMAKPLPEHIKAIREFPTPVNITDMRSYWALVNQVAPHYCIRPYLEPFRELLKKDTPWYWDGVLQGLFEESREHISKLVLEGITRFDKTRWTAVCSDWSKVGIGYFLSQKYCKCVDITPICCVGGWKVCMVGSSFNSPAEANYAPIEGECLGVASALHKTRYYTQGCDKLLVCTDHKPLLGVLGDKELEKIDNPRLLRLKEKTLGWKFRIIHVPGRKLCGPDALSRAMAPLKEEVQMMSTRCPASQGVWERSDPTEECRGDYCSVMTTKDAREGILGAIRAAMCVDLTMPDPALDVSEYMLASMELGVKSVSWGMVKEEMSRDQEFKDLSLWISKGCQGPPENLPGHIRQYWRVRDKLRLVEMVPMLEERTIIPIKMRKQVLETLHSAHQGVLSMGMRAEQAVYWPGFWSDIERKRSECSTCQKIAPSQAKLPPVEPIVPNYPFEHICIDYMSLNGHEFGVYVDRYTGWPGVYKGTKGFDVTRFLASLCEDYGVPVSCTSDGGTNLTSKEVEDLMRDYGIHHRISSMGNPHANSRAELGVKTIKRMLRDNVSANGSLDKAAISRALLQLRNTPDRDTKLSPARALFGRELRDFLPRPGSALMGDLWIALADKREMALGTRSMKAEAQWSEHTRALPPLKIGDHVMIQNQRGNHPLRWDKRGTVVKCEGHDQYQVVVDGSRRLTRRNRKFLRLFTPYVPTINDPQETDVRQYITDPVGKQVQAALPGHMQHQDHVQPNQQPVPQHHVPDRQLVMQDNGDGHAQTWPEDSRGEVDTRDQTAPGAEGQERDDGPMEQQHQRAEPSIQQNQGNHRPRRSPRARKGQTSKYDDFVRSIDIGASATYAQVVWACGGGGVVGSYKV